MMSLEDQYLLAAETVTKFGDAIRAHRDQRGDDRCFEDDETLYSVLPEGYTPPAREVAVELSFCEKFIRSRRHPRTEYVSPQREIERLEEENGKLTAENKLLREEIDGLRGNRKFS